EMEPGGGAKVARSGGTSAEIVGKDDKGKYVVVKLKSGETRRIVARWRGRVGMVGNEEYSLVNVGKAGINRERGIGRTVRGSVMNGVDDAHGGG
ncbi:50S ribosomal protein L2, partial [Mycoplasmopsis synoviae]